MPIVRPIHTLARSNALRYCHHPFRLPCNVDHRHRAPFPQLPQQLNPGSPMRRPTGEPNVMSPDLNESKPFCSPQDQIQWGILFLSRHFRGSSPWEREECLQDVWDWARKQGNLLCLQIIRDYRECLKENGPTYRRHQDWFLSNWNDPEFWAEWEKRCPGPESERAAESVCIKLARERERHCASEGRTDPL